IFIMGVSGVGKTTIGLLLSEKLSVPYFDGDDFHPEENVKKMADGHPLNDDDRYGWLVTLNSLAMEQQKIKGCIIGCSALKEKYRDILKKGIEDHVKWVFLNGTFDLMSSRINARKDHYMPPSLLQSQCDTLEIPVEALNVSIENLPEEIVEIIIGKLLNKSEFGLIGLGVMGIRLARNLASHGFKLSIYNRHVKDVEDRNSV